MGTVYSGAGHLSRKLAELNNHASTLDYFFSRINGVTVTPTSNPSGEMKRVTVCPHGSFLFLMSIRYPRDSSSPVASSTLSTSNSIHACGTGVPSGHVSLPKQDCAA